MGENEQGGMLRTVVVIGIIAMVALIVTLGVVGLKNNMTKNTDSAVGAVVTTKVPFGVTDNGNATYGSYTPDPNHWSGNWYRLPLIGEIPSNSWREIHVNLTTNTDLDLAADINDYDYDLPGYTLNNGNDSDVINKRSFKLYENGNIISSSNLKKGHTYDYVIKYFNGTPRTLYDGKTNNLRTALVLSSPNGSPVGATINSVEAATYDDKYNK